MTVAEQLRAALACIDDGDYGRAEGYLLDLLETFEAPAPSRESQAAVLKAMRDGHRSATAITERTGLKRRSVYAARYALLERQLVWRWKAGNTWRWAAC